MIAFLSALFALAVGSLCALVAYLLLGDRQPGYLFIAGTFGFLAALEFVERRWRPRV